MDKQKQQEQILSKIDAMVSAWNSGDIEESQKHYDYILGWCESAGYEFSATINGGINRLLAKCVGIEDTKKYTQYINGTSNFHF